MSVRLRNNCFFFFQKLVDYKIFYLNGNILISIHRLAAIELNRKSQMISEAVEEVLNLVQDATQKFKSMMSTESEDLAQSNQFYIIMNLI